MRAVLAVMHFEIRYQLRSPFFVGALVMFALIHFLTITGTGIHLDISNQVPINSAYAILQTEVLLFNFGMLPVLAFVTNAMTRDFDHATASLVYVTPVSPQAFVLGKFLGALSLALSIGVAGLLGAVIGTLMPWLDQERIAPFSLLPWAYVFFVVILPGTIVLCAIFLSVAALTRSFALTFASAMAFFVANVFLNLFANRDSDTWAALADPSGRLTVLAETRYWTVAELNAQLPLGLVLQNRLLWLTVAVLALLLVLRRFHLDLEQPPAFQRKKRAEQPREREEQGRPVSKTSPQPAIQRTTAVQSFSRRASLAQFVSQLKMDLSCVFKSPLIYIILALEIASLIGEFLGNVSMVGYEAPIYPLTSQMLPFLRYGMHELILLVGLWYSAELIHRERASRIDELVNASPSPDGLMIIAKTATLCLVVVSMMLVAVLTLMGLQTSRGYTNFELGVYLQSALIYNGFYYCMLCILALIIQTISPNKWLGLLLTLGVYIGLLSLAPMGYDHVLYNFNIPAVAYSDMNGFGHFKTPVFSLIAYWGAFCVLLIIAAHLLYPRGNYSSVRERLRDAGTRFGTGVRVTSGFAAIAFIGVGSWIFYNTNVLNEYLTPNERLQRKADYERNYGRYEDAPTPSYDSLEMAVDIFPEERRLESRGIAILGNHKQAPISEFVVSLNPVLHVNQMAVDNAVLAHSDKALGFYLYRLNAPLIPGATVKMTWNLTRRNEGFVAANPDGELVANGTFVTNQSVTPIPGYDEERRIEDDAERRRYGLPPRPRTAALGDPARLYKLAYGVDSRTAFEIVLSTSADQIAVAPGVLKREWQEGGRRYFHYKAEAPILPYVSINSARYAVARDRWKDVALEIYYDPKHPFNIATMMATAKRALEFFSTELAPYQYSYLRILECPRYLKGARFHPGTVPYTESIGFVTDLRGMENIDYGVIHEVGHMWWGDRITGAQMQGRQMLNENMVEYCTHMLYREYYPALATRLTRAKLDFYLDSRKEEDEAELPLIYAEERGHKGPLALYALQDIIGKEKVHQALRNFLRDYSFKTSPCPTSRDLIRALRAEAGPEYQQLITDLFERIVLYDVQVDAARAREVDGGYEVTVEVTARQFEADGRGKETEEPLDSWFDVAVFPESTKALEGLTPLYMEKHRLHSGKQVFTVRISERPGSVVVDPLHMRIDRNLGNNTGEVAVLPRT